jgi:alpha-L-fucosidase
MVKRRKQEEISGVLEFAGLSSEDPTFKQWVAEHRAQNGGNLRMSKGATGVRVMFSKEADMAFWKARSETEAKERKSHAA